MLLVRPGDIEESDVSDETSHFNYPGSDIILRSCDSHNFRLPRLYIEICSPILRKLVQSVSRTLDTPNVEEKETLSVVKLPESKATLYGLLTFIFPVNPILPPTAEKIIELLAVAQKYQMDSVVSHIRGAISRQDPPFVRRETAFHVYFLAQQYKLRQEAVQAARLTLQFSMTIQALEEELDFPGMTGAYLHDLWKYYEQFRANLRSSLLEFRNSGLPGYVKSLRCRTPRSHSTSFPQWLNDYIDSIAEAPHLFHLIEFENAWASHIQSSANSSTICSCASMPSYVIRNFWEALTAVVHRTIEKVCRIGVTRLHRYNYANTHTGRFEFDP